MPHLFHRRDKGQSFGSTDDSPLDGAQIKERRSSIFRRQSIGSEDGAQIKERRSSIFRRRERCSEESDIVQMIRPQDTVVTRIYESSESPTLRRRRHRRRLVRS
ncbi:unnamed protein product [Peronospora destructor]|uniref:Uncharacterized protein n=1 Tax=Peronospora destructor TaxID=86335 RepID=A0AAV0TNW5_9STRA|nr:unnamed protein product [Peronospora destructor]